MLVSSKYLPLLAVMAALISASCRLPVAHKTPTPEYAQALLAEHNRYRAEVGAPALVWDEGVAAYAQEWANRLAKRKGQLEHRSRKLNPKNYGENLAYRWWSGSRPASYTTQAVIKQWGDEKQYFRAGKIFDACCSGGECGHYTQMIWAKSLKVGCGMVQYAHKGGMAEVWVCNYDPAGNWMNAAPLTK